MQKLLGFLIPWGLLLTGCASPPRVLGALVHLDVTLAPLAFLIGLIEGLMGSR